MKSYKGLNMPFCDILQIDYDRTHPLGIDFQNPAGKIRDWSLDWNMDTIGHTFQFASIRVFVMKSLLVQQKLVVIFEVFNPGNWSFTIGIGRTFW